MEKAMKAIVVGRHAPDFGNEEIEVIKVCPITFPMTGKECRPVIEALIEDAKSAGAALLFQNTPGQVTRALISIAASIIWEEPFNYYIDAGVPVGVVITTPGARPGVVEMAREVSSLHAEGVKELIKCANPRAKVSVNLEGHGTVAVHLTVDGPPSPFEFDHIEWLY